MTVIVGILCSDGVVIGADSSATFSSGQTPTIEQPTRKIEVINNRVIIAGTGQVGLGQRFKNIVDTTAAKNKFTDKTINNIDIGKYFSREAAADFSFTGVTKGQYGALMAFAHSKKHYLCEFAIIDFQPEFKNDNIWYVSMGSGQSIVDHFFGLFRSIFWSEGNMPRLKDGIFSTVWALRHAIEVNTGGINGPIRIAVLKKSNGDYEATLLSSDEIAEHESNVDGMMEHMRAYTKEQQEGGEGIELPRIEKPISPV